VISAGDVKYEELFEPAAAVSNPPGEIHNRNHRSETPPNRQDDIGDKPKHGEGDPEDLFLHALNCKSFYVPESQLPRGCEKTSVLRRKFLPFPENCPLKFVRNQALGLSSSITL
jgi:hypothetical protein